MNAELEDRVEERTKRVKRANDALQRVAYIASHDLQEPLRTIVSFNQLMLRRYGSALDDTAREYLSYSEQSGRRMQHLVNDLLQYARTIEHAAEVPLHAVSAGECLRGALRTLEPAIREAGAIVESEELPDVLADRVQFEQVFQNLIANAVKYRHPDRTLVIRISARRSGSRWEFSVADNGIGFDAEYSQTIFEAFRRLHGTDVPGSGVGLAICKTVVESFGGEIWAESQNGSGATFSFTVPALPGAA